ncbi:MAG TPA: glycosyltransferase family 39 protein [Candidatus Omnitrophota bacterium]|nr:glycosyltransferase family 39 protein [Candidatus Omnitrophota bacterium]
MRYAKPLPLILIASLLLKLFYWWELTLNPLPKIAIIDETYDQSRFYQAAIGILSGDWLASSANWFSPVYSYFIALILKITGADFYHVLLVQTLIGWIGIILIYKSVQILFKDARLALLSACLFAFYAPFTFYEGILNRDILITYGYLFSFYAALKTIENKKSIWLVMAAFSLGLTMVLRGHVLPLLLGIYLPHSMGGSWSQKCRHIILFVLIFTLTLAPFWLRDQLLSKKTSVSSQGFSVFWVGNTYESSGLDVYRTPLRESLTQETEENLFKAVKIFIREIKKHPREYQYLYLRKFYMLFNSYEIPANMSFDQANENSRILRFFIINASFVLPLALLGMFLCWAKRKECALLYLFTVILLLGVVLFHVQARYRLPAIPYLIIFAAYSLSWLLRTIYQRRILLCAGGLCLWSLFSAFTSPADEFIKRCFISHIRPSDYLNLAIAYYFEYSSNQNLLNNEKKDFILQKVSVNLEQAIKYWPAQDKKFISEISTMLGDIYWIRGKRKEALATFEKALLLNPNSADLRRSVEFMKGFGVLPDKKINVTL